MTLRIQGIPTDDVQQIRGGGLDANGQAPLVRVAEGVAEGVANPCRHCLDLIAEGDDKLVLAYRPFDRAQPYAETGPIFLHRDTFDAWPQDLQNAMREAVAASVKHQRGLAEEEDVASRKAIVDEGCEIADLTEEELSAFSKAVQPLWADAQKTYGKEMFAMVPA